MAPDSPAFERLMTEQIRGLVHTVADLPGMTEAQRAAKQQTVADSFRSFEPRDGIEIILASHCVIYDEILQSNSHGLLSTPAGADRQRGQPGILAIGKLCLNTINMLLRKQGRATVRTAGQSKAAAPAGPPREATESVTPPIAPDLMPKPVNVPRSQQLTDAAKFGAVFRQRNATMPFPDRPPAAEFTWPRDATGVSHAAMLTTSCLPGTGAVRGPPQPITHGSVYRHSLPPARVSDCLAPIR
jgi:hypothetical protein